MKRLLLIIALLMPVMAVAQQKHTAYAELLGFQKGLFSNKVTVRVDFGQDVSFWKQGDMKIVDSNGKEIVFNSMVDAMNFMGKCGWVFTQAYVVTEGNQNVYHWLMTKQVASDEDIKAGFNVKADMREDDKPKYALTYLKKSKNASQWDVVKTETRKLSQEEISAISDEWKSQSNDNYDYDFQVKREK